MSELEFSRPVAVDRLSAKERRFDIVAEEAERAALARRFGILTIEALQAEIRLSTMAGGAVVRLQGRFTADVVQACVVTLGPVPAHLEEDFDLTYSSKAPDEEEDEVVVDLDVEDPPELIVDGIIDIGEATAEHLALALDPFPHAPGAVFEAPPEAAGEGPDQPGGTNPFAALAALKKK
jgi:uncharacterized metal-binding protein YceD (DUF177 family)